VGEFIEQ